MDWQLKIEALLADVRAKAEGGFTLAEIGQLVVQFLQTVVSIATLLQNSNADKKALVMAAAERLFDVLAPALPLGWFAPFRRLIVPRLKVAYLLIVDGAVEAIYARLKQQINLLPANQPAK